MICAVALLLSLPPATGSDRVVDPLEALDAEWDSEMTVRDRCARTYIPVRPPAVCLPGVARALAAAVCSPGSRPAPMPVWTLRCRLLLQDPAAPGKQLATTADTPPPAEQGSSGGGGKPAAAEKRKKKAKKAKQTAIVRAPALEEEEEAWGSRRAH